MLNKYALTFTMTFPSGLCAGMGSDGNLIQIARDGAGQAVLRGTSLAGVLRHNVDEDYKAYFGAGADAQKDEVEQSSVKVADVTFEQESYSRKHNAIDRHWGAALDGALFDIELLPAGIKAKQTLWIEGNDKLDNPEGFIKHLTGVLKSGLYCGGNKARGVGRMEIEGDIRCKKYNADNLDQYLDDNYNWRKTNAMPDGELIEAEVITHGILDIELPLVVPAGQDILIGSGKSEGGAFSEPLIVRDANNNDSWLIPGSTIRGNFRSWMTRLAAKDGFKVADSYECHLKNKDAKKGDDLAWDFKDESERENHKPSCPILDLFGSFYSVGRIVISDATAPYKDTQKQKRTHVAIHPISGGAIPGALFENNVAISSTDDLLCFNVKIQIKNPKEEEVKWLAKTIKALDMGILRIGSSKASGRLALQGSPKATGLETMVDLFNKFNLGKGK